MSFSVSLGWSRKCRVPVCPWALSWHRLSNVRLDVAPLAVWSDCSTRWCLFWGWGSAAVSPFLLNKPLVSPSSGLDSQTFSSPLMFCNATSLQTVHRSRHFTVLLSDILSSRWTLGFLTGILIRCQSGLVFFPPCLLCSLYCSSFLSPSVLHFACFRLPTHLFSLHLCLVSL